MRPEPEAALDTGIHAANPYFNNLSFFQVMYRAQTTSQLSAVIQDYTLSPEEIELFEKRAEEIYEVEDMAYWCIEELQKIITEVERLNTLSKGALSLAQVDALAAKRLEQAYDKEKEKRLTLKPSLALQTLRLEQDPTRHTLILEQAQSLPYTHREWQKPLLFAKRQPFLVGVFGVEVLKNVFEN